MRSVSAYEVSDISLERSPFEDTQSVLENTVEVYSGNDAPELPLARNLERSVKRLKWEARLVSWGRMLFFLGIAALCLALLCGALFSLKEALLEPLLCVFGMTAVLGFMLSLPAMFCRKDALEYTDRAQAAYGDYRLLQSGELVVAVHIWNAHGEKQAFTGVMWKPDAPDSADSAFVAYCEKNTVSFPFVRCIYIKEISEIYESAQKDMLYAACSGTVFFLERQGEAEAGKGKPAASPYYHYYTADFDTKKFPLPKRDWDNGYQTALERLRGRNAFQ